MDSIPDHAHHDKADHADNGDHENDDYNADHIDLDDQHSLLPFLMLQWQDLTFSVQCIQPAFMHHLFLFS